MTTDYVKLAQQTIDKQTSALQTLKSSIGSEFDQLVRYILSFQGRVVMSGMGKSGYIARKIAASLASTGTPAFFVHPGEASHGDLGMITNQDMVIMLSNSGETKELFDMIDYAKHIGIKIASITMNSNSTLSLSSDFPLVIPKTSETTSLVSAPTTSALMALSLCHALVTVLLESRKFCNDQFKLFHPGGKIGVNLMKVKDLMHKGEEIPFVQGNTVFSDVIVMITQKRLGCAVVVDSQYKLLGVITDGDVRRHINDDLAQIKAREVMTQSAYSISADKFASDALKLMNEHNIIILPIIESDRVIGVIHIHDIIKQGIGE